MIHGPYNIELIESLARDILLSLFVINGTIFSVFFSVKPLSVSILSSNQPLSADRKYNISCQAVGSRPPANITWWMDAKALDSNVEKVRKCLINKFPFDVWKV